MEEENTTEKETTHHTILIVDDDTFLLDMYAMRFTEAKFHVETAMNAKQTIEKLQGGMEPHVILLDVVMPAVDGFELLEEINTLHLAPKSIKIYLTNLGLEEDIARGTSLGAASYIIKANSTPSEVVTHVLEVIKNHGL